MEALDNDDWFDDATQETKGRLLRVLLPFTQMLPMFTWANAFETCFFAAPAPCLTYFEVWVEEEKGISTWDVLKATPALVRIYTACASPTSIDSAALQSITTALRNGGLQNLEEVEMANFDMSGGDVRDFLIALVGSGCAKRLTYLQFIDCGFSNSFGTFQAWTQAGSVKPNTCS